MRFAFLAVATALSSSAFAANIAIYDDLYSTPWSGTAATNLGHTVGVFYLDGAGFSAACAAADLCIVESPNYGSDATAVAAITSAVTNGKPVIVEYWKFQSDPAFNTALNISAVDYYTPLASHSPAGSVNFFSSISTGSLAWPGSYDAGINGSTFSLIGGGFLATAQSTIAVTRGDKAIANGFLSFDFQNADADGDGTLDVVEIYEREIEFLLGGGGRPTINLVGSPCPSSVTAQATGFTGGGTVAIVRSNGTGAAVIPSGPCAGTTLGLSTSGLGLITTITAPASGTINYAGAVSAGVCGKYIQMVDMATCTVSNVDQF
jgi:hypothetical protein